ncbi:hypothetical protein FRC06_000441 [Ceratobasidium sp. 370]|nr:hypothetical protein FRC06_000441 [Ceratobasidium sp. 370]
MRLRLSARFPQSHTSQAKKVNIPHSDAESDDSDTTVLELASSAGLGGFSPTLDIAVEAEETPTEPHTDLVDYDAEGEDEDEDVHMQDLSLADHSSYTALGHTDNSSSTAGAEATSSSQPICQHNLNNLHFGGGHSTDGTSFPDLTNTNPRPPANSLAAHTHYLVGDGPQHGTQGPDVWELFATHQLNTAVNDLQAHPFGVATADNFAEPRSSPMPFTNDLPHPHPPLSRIPTPAPWILVPETQVPTPRRPKTPLPWSQPTPLPPVHDSTRYMLVSHTGAPTGSPFSLCAPTASRPHPRLSTRQLASQACTQAQSSRLQIPPPTNLTDTENLHTRSHSLPDHNPRPPRLTPLRLSLSLPDFLDGTRNHTDDSISEGEEERLDPNAS